MSGLVLVVEDERILGDSIRVYLEHHGYAAVVARSGEEGLRLAAQATPDVAVVDLRLPGIDGLEVLGGLRELSPSIEVVMTTAHGSIASAVEAMRRGAFDYLAKPVDLDELRVVIDKALAHLRLRRELTYLRGRSDAAGGGSGILGDSPGIVALRAQIDRIAGLEAGGAAGAPTVLILGETGTGKELVARAVHQGSVRAAGPFVEINCAAIPGTLLEAELFGYEKGAYTDARAAKPGLLEAADGGTVFLDEIGHMDVSLQVKLLKVIEEKSSRRVGGLRAKPVNVRVVAATNRDLEAAIAEGTFRADLYYRIKVLTIEVPPLRTRGGDILLLARHFLDRCSRQYGFPPKRLDPDAEGVLQRYGWPGNVRELLHVIERAALLHKDLVIRADDLGLGAPEPTPTSLGSGFRGLTIDLSAGGIVLEDVERALILQALELTGWNRAAAAHRLGISKDTLRYRMEKFRLPSSK